MPKQVPLNSMKSTRPKMLLKLLLVMLSCSVEVKSIPVNSVDVLMSFLTFERRPVSLLMPYLCWTSYEMKILARGLNAENVAVANSLQPNRSEHQLQRLVVLADFSCPGTTDFLMKASEQGYFKSPYRWLLLDLDSSDQLDILERLDILVDSDVVVARGQRTASVLLIEAYRISDEFNVIYNTRLQWHPTNSSNSHDRSRNEETVSSSNSNISVDTAEETNATLSPNDNHVIKIENDKEKVVNKVIVTKYGIIEDYRQSPVLLVRRKDLRRHTLTMVNVIAESNDTRNHMDDRLQLHQDSITKMTYMVVKICFEMLNASEKLIFTHTWGYKDKHGNWQGIVDHLLKKDADLGTLTIFTQERMQIIDYIAMVGSTAVRFVFREPPLAYISNIFALPFTGAVWLAIFICVLGCAMFLYITSRWEASMSMHPLQLDGSWADVLILIIGAVLQQGCTLEPRYAAGRCVTLLLFVALTILYAAYSANIVVLLRAPSSSVRSLTDLLNSPLKLGASDFEYNRYFFKKLNEPIRKEIYDKKIAPKGKPPNFYSMKDGVEKIRKSPECADFITKVFLTVRASGLFALHMETNPGYRLIQETYQEDEKCDLVEIDYINEIDPWVPGQKRSPFKDLFKINFIKIRESGIQSSVHRRLHVPRPRCSGTVSTFSSVGITDMYPAMLATLYGMLMAPAVLVLEILYHRIVTIRRKRKMIKKQGESS